jgi:hypothetical protein
MPHDPRAPATGTFLEDRWTWIEAVASRARRDGLHDLVGRIGLMTEVWNRHILKSEPRLQFGRLVEAPRALEVSIYESALSSLAALDADQVLVVGLKGWSAGDAFEQIAQTVRIMVSEGDSIPERLRLLSTGDPTTVDSVNGEESQLPSVPDDDSNLTKAIAKAKSGDEAEGLFIASVVAESKGDTRLAFELLERAARLGHRSAMVQAGVLAGELGDRASRHYWAEAAANAGDPAGMFNLAVNLNEDGDQAGALRWFQSAAETGNGDGYAALVELAEQRDDQPAAEKWAARGAGVGHAHCLERHGYFLYSAGDRTGGLSAMESGAELGNCQAMVMAGIMRAEGNDVARARYWLLKARDAGDPGAAEMMDRMGIS